MTSNLSLQELCGFNPTDKLLGYELEGRMSSVSNLNFPFISVYFGKQNGLSFLLVISFSAIKIQRKIITSCYFLKGQARYNLEKPDLDSQSSF